MQPHRPRLPLSWSKPHRQCVVAVARNHPMLRKLPQLDHVRRIARLTEQPAAWAHYLVGRRRRRVAAAAVPPAVFDPGTIASLRLWLRGDDIAQSDGSPVSAWADASGHGNSVTQATGMKMPTFAAAQLNGHSYLYFDGVDDTLFKTSPTGFEFY